MLTLSNPKCSDIVNFYDIPCEQKGNYQLFLCCRCCQTQGNVACLNFRKLMPNNTSVLAGHDSMKNKCYLNLVKCTKN